MSKNYKILLRLCFALITFAVAGADFAAAQTLSGTWTANDYDSSNWGRRDRDKDDDDDRDDARDSKDRVQLNFQYETARGNKSNQGSGYDYADLQGLSRAQVEGANQSSVNFRIVREAGTIECTGSFQNGKGGGTFRFTANPQFVSQMRARGFDFEKSNNLTVTSGNRRNFNDDRMDAATRLFAATTINVTVALADDLKSANFPNLDVDDLFKAAIFKINSGFMREMAATGFPNLGMDELVKARIFKIDASFVRRITGMGFANQPFESLVKMSIFKISPEFISEIRDAGFRDISIEQLVKMKIFNINGEFIRKARAEEGNDLSVEDLVQMRIGVRTRSRRRAI